MIISIMIVIITLMIAAKLLHKIYNIAHSW